MSLAPAVLDAMLTAGCTAEQIVAAVKADAAIDEQRITERRAKDAERQRKCRSKGNVGHTQSRDVTVTPCDERDPPNDIYSNPPVPPSSANADDTPPPIDVRFVEAWNAESGLRQARKLAGQRLTKFRKRLSEFGEETLFEAVRKLGASAFHCGKNDREWQADIGWFLKSDDNVTKALELPDPKRPATGGADPIKTAESAAALYRRMGRDEDAAEAEQRAVRLRERATGPPRPIGQVLQLPQQRTSTA